MKNKKKLSAKKFFLNFIFFWIFFFWIFFNSSQIFAEKNIKLEKKIEEVKTEIKKIKIEKNICDDLLEDKNKDKDYLDKIWYGFENTVLNPENYWISEKWINSRDEFLDEVEVWWFQEIINSFTIQFSWNYCFQRDLQKIDQLLYFAIDYWVKLAENCYFEDIYKKDEEWKTIKPKILINNWNEIKEKIINIIWDTINTEESEKEVFQNINNESFNDLWIKWLKQFFEKEVKYYEENLYWFSPKKCEEDSITDAMKKIEEFKQKIEDLTSWEWAFFDNFSFDIDYEKIEEQAKIDAENYLTENLNSTLLWFWIKAIIDENWEEENIFETITKISQNLIKKIQNSSDKDDENNKISFNWDTNNVLDENQTKIENSEYAKYAKEFFQKDKIFNEIEEDATNQIIANLWWLEIDIIMANWNKKELDEVIKEKTWLAAKVFENNPMEKWTIDNYIKIDNKTKSKELKTLKNFIIKLWDFLNKHNTKTWEVESKWILNYWWESDYQN